MPELRIYIFLEVPVFKEISIKDEGQEGMGSCWEFMNLWLLSALFGVQKQITAIIPN